MSNELARQSEQLPDFMREQQGVGTEGLAQYVVPPRIKVVQKMSRAPLSEQFDVGDAVLVPQGVLIAPIGKTERGKPGDDGEPFHFAPVFFFPEWCAWNPLEVAGTVPAIRARSLDSKSEVARKANDPNARFEPYPENPELQIRYVEHLNFMVVLLDSAVEGTLAVMSFARAEHRAGSNFASLIKMRKGAPIFGCQFQAQVHHRANPKGDWHGFDVTNPDPARCPGYVQDREAFQAYAALHQELKEKHAEALVRVDYDNDDLDSAPADSRSEF